MRPLVLVTRDPSKRRVKPTKHGIVMDFNYDSEGDDDFKPPDGSLESAIIFFLTNLNECVFHYLDSSDNDDIDGDGSDESGDSSENDASSSGAETDETESSPEVPDAGASITDLLNIDPNTPSSVNISLKR